jgi:SagB-type dehydrogenase family enzyme
MMEMKLKKGIGDLFQEKTKYQRGKLPGGYLIWHTKPETYKRYPSAPRIKLSVPDKEGGMPLFEAVQNRRSLRDFREKPLDKRDLSQLLWACQGITKEYTGYQLRAAPSAGALYPVETYLFIHDVKDIHPGIYHYAVPNHQLEQLRKGDFREDIARAALDQGMAFEANVVFAWTAIFERSKWKYKQRGYRYVYLDAGHIAQNLALAAVSLGLGSCQVAALYDNEVNKLLEVDGERESILYLSAVGHP